MLWGTAQLYSTHPEAVVASAYQRTRANLSDYSAVFIMPILFGLDARHSLEQVRGETK